MSHDIFTDLDRLRFATLPDGVQTERLPTRRAPAPKPKRIRGEFLRGPIPLAWLTAAAMLPGKAPLAVGLALWFEAGRRRSGEVRLTTAILGRFGVSRKSKYRGLKALENAGLVRVRREPRRNPVVTILEVPASPESTEVARVFLAQPSPDRKKKVKVLITKKEQDERRQ